MITMSHNKHIMFEKPGFAHSKEIGCKYPLLLGYTQYEINETVVYGI